jgi:hypothetical protein
MERALRHICVTSKVRVGFDTRDGFETGLAGAEAYVFSTPYVPRNLSKRLWCVSPGDDLTGTLIRAVHIMQPLSDEHWPWLRDQVLSRLTRKDA